MDEERELKRAEDMAQCAGGSIRRQVEGPFNPDEILDVARKIEEYVNNHHWSWCMMDRVYRVLKTIHG